MLKGFKDFLFRGNVVDLAVAVVIGTAFAALVAGFTASFVNPLIAYVGGGGDFGFATKLDDDNALLWGVFLNAIVTFVITAAVIYFIIVLPMKKIQERRARGQEAGPAAATDLQLLAEIRDLLAAQRGMASGDQPKQF